MRMAPVGVRRGFKVFLWYNPQVAKIAWGIRVIAIPTVCLFHSVLGFKSPPPSYFAGGSFALLGLAVVGLEVLLIIWLL